MSLGSALAVPTGPSIMAAAAPEVTSTAATCFPSLRIMLLHQRLIYAVGFTPICRRPEGLYGHVRVHVPHVVGQPGQVEVL